MWYDHCGPQDGCGGAGDVCVVCVCVCVVCVWCVCVWRFTFICESVLCVLHVVVGFV